MTPERAAELAYGIFPLALLPDSELEYMAEALKHCILAACAEQKEQDAELYEAAQALREHIDRRYNQDPRSCLIMNCPEQQRLWRALDDIRSAE